MSAKSLTFAMSQNTLSPVEQLALIVIADCCGERFTFSNTVLCVAGKTSLTLMQAENVVNQLVEKKLIVSAEPGKQYLVPDEEPFVVNTGAV